MKYILDFDRTIFDTDRLYKELESTGNRDLAGTIESLDKLNVPDLIFADAIKFISMHNKLDIVVVTSCLGKTAVWDKSYQEEKIKRSGIRDLVGVVDVVVGEKPKAVLKHIQTDRCVFVDDMEKHLLSVKKAIPEIICVQISRTKNLDEKTSEFVQISTLAELDVIIGEQ